MSPPPDPECILQSAALAEVLTLGKMSEKWKEKTPNTNGRQTIINTGKHGDASGDHEGVEEQQVNLGPVSEDDVESIVTALWNLIADEVMSQVANALARPPGMVEGAVEKLFSTATLSVQGGVGTVVHETLEHVILDQIRMNVLGDTICKHAFQYFRANKMSAITLQQVAQRRAPRLDSLIRLNPG